MQYLYGLDPFLFDKTLSKCSQETILANCSSADIYMKLSLLMRSQILVSEPQAFISLASMPQSVEIADVWRNVQSENTVVQNPIVFGVQQQHGSLARACAAALENEKYTLAWAPKEPRVRTKLASLLRDGKFDDVSKLGDEIAEKTAIIESLDDYTFKGNRQKIPASRANKMSENLRLAHDKAQASDTHNAALGQLLSKLFASQTPTASRSEVLKFIANEADETLADEAWSLVNSIYNQVEAECLKSTGMVADATQVSEDGADDETAIIAERVRAENGFVTTESFYEIVPEGAAFLNTIPWAVVCEIMQDPLWQKSAGNVQSSRNYGVQQRQDVLYKHLEFLAERLKKHCRIDFVGNAVNIIFYAGNGASFVFILVIMIVAKEVAKLDLGPVGDLAVVLLADRAIKHIEESQASNKTKNAMRSGPNLYKSISCRKVASQLKQAIVEKPFSR